MAAPGLFCFNFDDSTVLQGETLICGSGDVGPQDNLCFPTGIPPNVAIRSINTNRTEVLVIGELSGVSPDFISSDCIMAGDEAASMEIEFSGGGVQAVGFAGISFPTDTMVIITIKNEMGDTLGTIPTMLFSVDGSNFWGVIMSEDIGSITLESFPDPIKQGIDDLCYGACKYFFVLLLLLLFCFFFLSNLEEMSHEQQYEWHRFLT